MLKPSTVLPESPMNIFVGGKLKNKNPTHAPTRLHATAYPSGLSAAPGISAYPSAITAVIPAAKPSMPSKKLKVPVEDFLWPDVMSHDLAEHFRAYEKAKLHLMS